MDLSPARNLRGPSLGTFGAKRDLGARLPRSLLPGFLKTLEVICTPPLCINPPTRFNVTFHGFLTKVEYSESRRFGVRQPLYFSIMLISFPSIHDCVRIQPPSSTYINMLNTQTLSVICEKTNCTYSCLHYASENEYILLSRYNHQYFHLANSNSSTNFSNQLTQVVAVTFFKADTDLNSADGTLIWSLPNNWLIVAVNFFLASPSISWLQEFSVAHLVRETLTWDSLPDRLFPNRLDCIGSWQPLRQLRPTAWPRSDARYISAAMCVLNKTHTCKTNNRSAITGVCCLRLCSKINYGIPDWSDILRDVIKPVKNHSLDPKVPPAPVTLWIQRGELPSSDFKVNICREDVISSETSPRKQALAVADLGQGPNVSELEFVFDSDPDIDWIHCYSEAEDEIAKAEFW